MLELLNGKESKNAQGLCDDYQTMQQDGTQVVGCYCIQIRPLNSKSEEKNK